MADTKITALTALTAADPANDVIPIVDVSDTSMAASGTTKKISVNNILGASGTATLASATITGALTVDTSTLVVDATNDRVGMGTATPGSRLDVRFTTNPAINNAVPTNALRVFTSVAQAVDVGGQIGLGGLYNATDFQAFGNISGKKENSTSGNNAGYLVVGTCDSGGTMAERARFNSTGAFVLAGGTTSANGIGVAFPATQSASSDANTLDDYEEGTFTPTVGGTATYLGQVGRYTKIGNRVFFNIRLIMGVIGTGSQSTISGLPFAVGASSDLGSVSVGYFTNLLLNVFYVSGFTVNGTSNIVMNATTAASGSITTPALVIGNNTDLVLSGFYTV